MPRVLILGVVVAFRNDNAPLVGLLYNPVVPLVLEEAGALVEYLEVVPEQLSCGAARNGPSSFHYVNHACETLKKCAKGRVVAGHGNNLSLLSAIPLEEYLLHATAAAARDMDFAWYSECLDLPSLPHGDEGAKTVDGLPFAYDESTFRILRKKLARVHEALGIPLMLENSSISAPAADTDMSEPEFLNRLYRELGCGIVLDLHTVYANWRNGGPNPQEYLAELDPAAVHEIHLSGVEDSARFHTSPHTYRTPPEVWSWAFEFVPRYKNLRAITFEFDENHFDRLGVTAIANELKCMHLLAHLVIRPREVSYA